MIHRRGLLKAALGCATTSLVGCASAPPAPKTDFITLYIETLKQALVRPDGTRDEISIALAFEYHRRNSGNKDIQGSIEKILKDNEISLQTAEDIWKESDEKARAIIDQGDEVVYKALLNHLRDRSNQVIHCPHPHPDGRKQGKIFPIARTDIPKLGMTSKNPTDSNVCDRITDLYRQQHGPVPTK